MKLEKKINDGAAIADLSVVAMSEVTAAASQTFKIGLTFKKRQTLNIDVWNNFTMLLELRHSHITVKLLGPGLV